MAITIAFLQQLPLAATRVTRRQQSFYLAIAGDTPAATVQNMCGIVGYVGRAQATPILLDGLRRLEYRGYDSAGVAIVNGDHIETRKCAGRIASLTKLISQKPAAGSYGISHTRWAT